MNTCWNRNINMSMRRAIIIRTKTVVGINYSGSFAWVEDSQMTLSHLYESLGGWGDGWGEIKFWKEFPEGTS